MKGNENGPFAATGCHEGWRMVECDDLKPCEAFDNCADCTTRARCGWCPSTPEESDAVRCVTMRLEDKVGRVPQWMPPSTPGWCPGGAYQHKYKEQCQSGQPTQLEAKRNGKTRASLQRAERYTSEMILLGDTVREQLNTLLDNVHAAKSQLHQDVVEAQRTTSKTTLSLEAFYTASNETAQLVLETSSKKDLYHNANTSYYAMLSTMITPGNATNDDPLIQVQHEQLNNVTRDRSVARDKYEESVDALAIARNKKNELECVASVHSLLSTSLQERADAMKQAATDDARVAEVVSLNMDSNRTSSTDAAKVSDSQAQYEDDLENVQTLETTSNVQKVQQESYTAVEKQGAKVKEARVLHSEAVRQAERNHMVKAHESWVLSNQTMLEELRTGAKSVESSSTESKELMKKEKELNSIDLKLANLFQSKNSAQIMKGGEEILAKLNQDRVLASSSVDAAQKKINAAIEALSNKIKRQEAAVTLSEAALNSAKQAADAVRNHKTLENLIMNQRQQLREQLATNETVRQVKREGTLRALALSRSTLRKQETDIYTLRKSSFAGEGDRVSAMVAGDQIIRDCTAAVKDQSTLALSTCVTNPQNATSKLKVALSILNDAVLNEHQRAFTMLQSETVENKDGKEDPITESREGAMFARNVGRAEAMKARDCSAMEKLQLVSKMLRRRVVAARQEVVDLSSPLSPSIAQSLQRSISNLDHQETKVMNAEGLMRVKCADATSFARKATEEALVAQAIRESLNTTTHSNSTTNSSL